MAMTEEAISMDEVKQKLGKLKEFLPNASNDLVYDFGHFLADYLNPRLAPEGFVMGCELALNDLQKGVNGFTGKPINHKLVGYPPMIYRFISMEIPRIADAVLPVEFATKVKIFITKINTKIEAK